MYNKDTATLERSLAAQIGVSYQFTNNVTGTAMMTVTDRDTRGYVGVRIQIR